MVRFQIIGNTYICTTIDAETVCRKADMLLNKTVRNESEREQRIKALRQWCRKARPGDSNIQEEFTVIVRAKAQN